MHNGYLEGKQPDSLNLTTLICEVNPGIINFMDLALCYGQLCSGYFAYLTQPGFLFVISLFHGRFILLRRKNRFDAGDEAFLQFASEGH